MSIPASKQIFINFIVKLLLILAIIGGGAALLIYNKDNTDYFKQKQQHVANLIELNDVLQKTGHAYLGFIKADTNLRDSLKVYLKDLAKKKNILESYSGENEVYKSDALAIKSSLDSEEKFYNFQLSAFLKLGASFTETQTAIGDEIGLTQPLLIQLIKLERDDLKVRIQQNDIFYERLGYAVVGVASLVLLMVVVFYRRSQKSLEEQLLHDKEIYNAKLNAQAANNAKTEYLGMISHEIRTPMNGVLGMANLLMQGSLSTEQREYTKTIHDSAESLLRIVNDILDFSKIEVGKVHLEKTSVDIRDLIAEAFAHLQKSKPGLSIDFTVDKNVPNAIYGDPKRLKQVLLNFLSNAVKFTEKGSVVLECTIIDKMENEDLRLGFVVKDTGIGIAEDRVKSLFKPFVQMDHSTMRKYGGTGLGLNIAYNLITMMGGKVKVKSEVGKGSAFTFFITTQEAFETQSPKVIKEQPKLILDNELCANYPFKILVVDDNDINLMLITKTLSKLGYDCKKASNGQLAVDMVRKEHFDLIFMDMQMPIMDGTVATTEIRKHYRVYEFPVVVALTANTLGDGKDKCLEAGMQDFIAKPFKPAEIEEVIRKWAPKIIDYKSKHQSNLLS
ncbi:response regulator [Pedobacter xixiisoli]|uniref:Sensory/regulatory protein RpfC n=1 Tax=Pedobacter xixiisoli TaxID=1476464 RepID=A0A285ZZ90_9SPHI|nr:response regulator [Pedobacter xixiisoli]SOD14969.1 His Kinase A (phospho-acceptor) domain-containing protein [Pedobacter xixiisoli]